MNLRKSMLNFRLCLNHHQNATTCSPFPNLSKIFFFFFLFSFFFFFFRGQKQVSLSIHMSPLPFLRNLDQVDTDSPSSDHFYPPSFQPSFWTLETLTLLVPSFLETVKGEKQELSPRGIAILMYYGLIENRGLFPSVFSPAFLFKGLIPGLLLLFERWVLFSSF